MPTVSDLFDVSYGQSLSLNKLHQTDPEAGVAFVSRTARNNGVAAWVEPVPGVEPNPAGLLTVALRSRNSALATFVQPRPFYCGYHIHVLTPKHGMTVQEKLWWAQCIMHNRFRYNFGRQANRTLASLELPDEIPAWVRDTPLPQFEPVTREELAGQLDVETWQYFAIGDLFDLARGRNITKRNMRPGTTPYVSASARNNGTTAWVDEPPDHPGGRISVCSNGSVGEAFYQPIPFIASGDVTVLTPRTAISEPAALFVCSILRAERYRWNYGRKWGSSQSRV